MVLYCETKFLGGFRGPKPPGPASGPFCISWKRRAQRIRPFQKEPKKAPDWIFSLLQRQLFMTTVLRKYKERLLLQVPKKLPNELNTFSTYRNKRPSWVCREIIFIFESLFHLGFQPLKHENTKKSGPFSDSLTKILFSINKNWLI